MGDGKSKYDSERYDNYYSRVLLKEQPFYYTGMTDNAARRELEYLNTHLDAFYEGSYVPLWRQDMYR